ncbi:Cytochrome P450 71C4 [Hordeum vulgare]|nr:Cytochrome P450 71C4 [Hordeum vulgare]
MHQARWHWKHRVALPYPDVTLRHDWHLDPERIPVPAVPQSTWVHLEEVTKRRPLPWRAPSAARRPSVAPTVVSDEDQEADAAYQAALGGVLRESEEDARRVAEEKEAYQRQLAEAMALSAVGDCVVPPPPEPEPEPALPRQVYQWTDVVQEFVSASPI